MKKLLLSSILLFFLTPVMAQYIATLKGEKVEVRDLKGKFIASGYYSHLRDITNGDEIVVLWYESDKIEIRSFDLKFIASGYYSKLKKVGASGNNIVLYYESGKIEVRDEKLRFVSSRFH
jgi:hypothetical protein